MTTNVLLLAAPVVVTLPAGLELLNSNQRLHHKRKAEYTREIRTAACLVARSIRPLPRFERAHILGIVHPTKRGRFDPPNWWPSFKAAIDGLVDAGLFEDDDSTRVVGPDMRPGVPVKGGQIEMHIRPLAAGQEWPDLGAAAA